MIDGLDLAIYLLLSGASMARINLRKFIAEHYKGGVSARDVIREALTNSIHAGSKNISVDLYFSERQQEINPGSEERRVLETITIVDDGEGFASENLNFFDEVCTGHKDSIGGKEQRKDREADGGEDRIHEEHLHGAGDQHDDHAECHRQRHEARGQRR